MPMLEAMVRDNRDPDWLRPVFSHPAVGALMTTRAGGVSLPPYDSLNLRDEVGDDPVAVARNRARVQAAVGLPGRLLRQVHGTEVVVYDRVPKEADLNLPPTDRPAADACVTAVPGVVCEIQVADCLPVLFADRQGRAVGAAHAGWRGLAGGVLEATLAQVCQRADTTPEQVECWLGACIGPTQFEVGDDVREAFAPWLETPEPAIQARPGLPGKWLADLPQLARLRLRAVGVCHLLGNDSTPAWCTLTHPERYFSYRHAPRTGRMAAWIWLDKA